MSLHTSPCRCKTCLQLLLFFSHYKTKSGRRKVHVRSCTPCYVFAAADKHFAATTLWQPQLWNCVAAGPSSDRGQVARNTAVDKGKTPKERATHAPGLTFRRNRGRLGVRGRTVATVLPKERRRTAKAGWSLQGWRRKRMVLSYDR